MRRLSLLVLLVLLAFIAPAAAQVPGNDEASKQLALKIARDWLQDNTAYKQIPDIQSWIVLSDDQMVARGRDLPGRTDVPGFIYSCGANRLYVQHSMNYLDPAALSLLVHELTHHAQCLARLPMNDICAVEREAYLNQQAFVRWLQARLAAAGHPLGPEVEQFARGINPLIDRVCAATRKPN